MGVEITKRLTGQYFAKNPLIIGANTDNHINTAEARPYLTLELSDTFSIGETFTITSPSNGIFLQFTGIAHTDTPDINQLRAKNPSMGLIEWASLLVADFQNNPVLSSFFDITFHSWTIFLIRIRITLRDSGDISYLNSLTNCVVAESTTDNDEVRKPNYKLRCEIFLERNYRSTEYESVNIIHQTPDTGGDVKFDVAPSVLPFLGVDIPGFAQVAGSVCTKMQKRFWARVFENYGDNPEDFYNITAYVLSCFAFKGGIPADRFNQFYTLVPVQSVDTIKFLTWAPNHRKKVIKADREYLYFRLDDAAISKVLVKVTYTDATTDTWTMTDHNISTAQQGDILLLPVGYNQLDIDTLIDSGKTVQYYEIILADTDDVQLYRSFIFDMDYREYDYRLTILFQNGFGAIETLHCTQAQSRTLQVQKEIAERTVLEDNDFTENPEKFDCNPEAANGIKVNTGSYPQANILQLEDMLRSHGYTAKVDSDRFAPVIIAPGTFELGKDDDDLYSLTFTFFPAFRELNYGDAELLENIVSTGDFEESSGSSSGS